MLLIEWSGGAVRVYDPGSKVWTAGTTLAECLPNTQTHEAVVAISSRSAFIRQVPVPSLPEDEMHRIIALKLIPLVPFQPGEYVFCHRTASVPSKEGKVAVVGAVKTSLVRDIVSQAKAAGLHLHGVVPEAFGAWLSARAQGLRDGAVVDDDGQQLSVNIIAMNELCYSRSIPLPESDIEVREEIARTFAMAGVAEGPIIRSRIDNSAAAEKRPIEFLADGRSLERHLFSIELPEALAARRRRSNVISMWLALAASVIAVALGEGEYLQRSAAQKAMARLQLENRKTISQARRDQSTALKMAEDAANQNSLVQLAFHPAQSFSDVIDVLGTPRNQKVWLNGLTLERGRPLILRGVAASGKDLADYVDQISIGDRFRGIRVLSATNATIGKKSVVQFSITGWVVGNLPVDVLPAKGSEVQ